MGEAVDHGDALAQICGVLVPHQVSTVNLETNGGVFQGEVQQRFTCIVNESMVKHILHRFDAHEQHPLSFFSAGLCVGDAALCQLDDMGNDVSVDGSCVGKQDAVPGSSRGMSFMALQPLLEQREQFVVPFLGHQFLQCFRRNRDKVP